MSDQLVNPTRDQTTAPETAEYVGDLLAPVFSADQAREMADELVKAGVLSKDAADAMLKADGHEAAEPDTRTEDEIAHDLAFGGEVNPSSYRIAYLGRIPSGVDVSGLAEFNGAATAWLADIGFPESIGAAVIERAMDLGQARKAMSEPEAQLWVREQVVAFERMAGGPQKAAERMKLASSALARAKDRGAAFTDLLLKSGALHDAGIVMHLSHQGERLAARG